MTVVTLWLHKSRDDSKHTDRAWEIRINGLIYSQRNTVIKEVPGCVLVESSGELFFSCEDDIKAPIGKSTSILKCLAGFNYKVITCTSTADSSGRATEYLWTLQM